ncbi:Lrp/AsnC family transcriptional regulator [Actinocorallia sp. A-T 12471]|uniref:Lrp/AsnC family transcriptional regulator n=1 Tax=Actinocorallia sp. A-T 12471 TaxID=3089813 RepID=UPI0029CC529B|nr:Lrp/AsnC ligand binding domain-containing protein [Actinocorallia sp. A-T 12471]MDX6742438.1 Lrp/AsnC ligand binding domain-containing protein [Actinocorallia sp. A-T 12471]
MAAEHRPDALDLALLNALAEHPRAGDLELSRLVNVARATVQSRLRRLEDTGVIRDWSPTLDVAAAGFPVHAFVSLEIAQGALTEVADELATIPEIIEAHATTGSHDVVCRVAAASHTQLQDVLVRLNQSPSIVRSTSVIALSPLIHPRTTPLLTTTATPTPRAPAYRTP